MSFMYEFVSVCKLRLLLAISVVFVDDDADVFLLFAN